MSHTVHRQRGGRGGRGLGGQALVIGLGGSAPGAIQERDPN